MNREIKFRAWDVDLQKMSYSKKGHFHVGGHGACAFCSEWLTALIDGGYVKDGGYHQKKILMQFTGLKDKNGVEVWEGDIVRWDYGANSPEDCDEGIWRNGVVMYVEKWGEFAVNRLFNFRVHVPTKTMEVIGNIHENREKAQ